METKCVCALYIVHYALSMVTVKVTGKMELNMYNELQKPLNKLKWAWAMQSIINRGKFLPLLLDPIRSLYIGKM